MYKDSYDRVGELVLQSIECISVKYGENTFTPWEVNGGYTIYNGVVTYDGVSDFENISSYIKNYNYKCRYLNLEIRNIDKSAENLVINVYGTNNEVANINIDFNKYSKNNINFNTMYYSLIISLEI